MRHSSPRHVPLTGRALLSRVVALTILATTGLAQETDITQTPNPIGAGIQRSFTDQVGAGHGSVWIPDSSVFLIRRDPFRSIARGRQVFQRKFTRAQGLGPRMNDGIGTIASQAALGAGTADSCASCHGRPTGAAGFGGDVFTRPDSRDAPHLFGIGLVEMLADEITTDLRTIRGQALALATQTGADATLPLLSKGISFGTIRAHANGTFDTTSVQGVDADLRVRPFFAEGKTASIREFVVGAFQAEMGLQAVDPVLRAAANGATVTSPAGMRFSGADDTIEPPPVHGPWQDADQDGQANEVPVSIVDHMEFYLLNYFKPGRGEETAATKNGRRLFEQIGCAVCHVPDLLILDDRRVADVETSFDPNEPGWNHLTAVATPLFHAVVDQPNLPPRKLPNHGTFLVQNLFADFKRHDLGPAFHERNFDGTVTTHFMTEPLWGVGSTAPYGHDGRSISLREVILRHGGEALAARTAFAASPRAAQDALVAFLDSLVLFPPPHTSSNLDPANPATPGFPQFGHGSIKLSVLFNDPSVPE